ncbi:ATP-dependent zinc metalloprotease FtsH [Gossypium australe]|uniref:ATP-dependent zinc metalloprotease FtsH n=1 Tax=Gossypium australe TaxID=47621 RepID=A0A5B6WYK0_9ROSI|nr:ATP-dependent zinc metalloprotease FtsH [Gossypium australe]
MSAREHRRSTCGRGRGRGAEAEFSESRHEPEGEAPASPMAEAGSQDRTVARKSIPEQLRANGAEIFRGISGVAPNVAEYWLGDFFKTAFQGKYVGASYVDAQRKAFLNFVQWGKSMAEYEVEFLRLSRYARGIVTTNYERCIRFKDGLRDELRVLIAPQQERDFAILVEKTKITEEVKRTERQNRDKDKGKNKRSFGSSTGVQKRPRFDGPARVVIPAAVGQFQPCALCGKMHLGECWRRTGGCFKCGSKDHMIKACPQELDKVRPIGQGFAQFRIGDVITDTFLIVDKPFIALIDIGSTHSYVASTASETLLLEKSSCEFGCAAKRMVLRAPEDKEVIVIGERRNYLSNVVSALKADRMVQKGCSSFLAFISALDARELSIRDVRTVKEFVNVFPEKLSGLPPDREVEFGIELLPRTAPVSIAPYRMA